MGMFKRKKDNIQTPPAHAQDYSYLTNVKAVQAEGREKYWINDKVTFTPQELLFISKLANAMSDAEIKDTEINRMSDDCLNFTYKGMQFGRIKISKRAHWMQLLTGLTNVSDIEGNIDYYIAAIPIWITYIRKELIDE